MQVNAKLLEQVAGLTGIPLTLLNGYGEILESWPSAGEISVSQSANATVLEDFRLQKRDQQHPIISFLEPGFLLGVMQLSEDRFLLIGLVSPVAPSRMEVLTMLSEAVHPLHLQRFCDRLLSQPLVSLERMKDLMSLLSRLLGEEIHTENILFVDNVSGRKLGSTALEHSLFDQREQAEEHVPVDFETAICSAVEAGDRVLLEKSLFSPQPGRIGRMSQNELRQQKYSFICLATLVSRAAIRGGLPAETAFSLSDLYCQRADLLTDVSLIQNLIFTMLMDYCGKVKEIRKRPDSSPVISKCLDYISVHLHEPLTVELLSQHCNLCTRSLSIRFRKELGMGIPEYIHREKLREAEYLLRHTDYSLTEISSYLKYPSQSHFTQVFKKYKGQTPQQYRACGG